VPGLQADTRFGLGPALIDTERMLSIATKLVHGKMAAEAV
jgi:hypothetical protein